MSVNDTSAAFRAYLFHQKVSQAAINLVLTNALLNDHFMVWIADHYPQLGRKPFSTAMIVLILVALAIMVISHVRSDTLSKTEGLNAWLQSRQRSPRAESMIHLVPMLALCGLFTVSRWPELAVDYPLLLSIAAVVYLWAIWAADIVFPPRASGAGA